MFGFENAADAAKVSVLIKKCAKFANITSRFRFVPGGQQPNQPNFTASGPGIRSLSK
jgi:hypothetical protein